MPPLRYSRPSQNRRPPFYPLVNPKELQDLSLEDSELFNDALLVEFDDGTFESVKQWYTELLAISKWLYQPGSPCLVDPSLPTQHSVHLSEANFSVREKAAPANSFVGRRLLHLLCSPTFQEKYIKPWSTLSKKSKEDLLLGVFADFERSAVAGHGGLFSRHHKLVPEFSIPDLVAKDGKGFTDLLDLLRTHLADPEKLSTHPIPNAKFYNKFGIGRSGEELPLTRADRAFHEEYLARRHSLLISVTIEILLKLAGKKSSSYGAVGNTASEMTRKNRPDLDDKNPGMSTKALSEALENLVDEKCEACGLTAQNVGLKKLLYCGKCKKVDRIVPYCSTTCQRSDWTDHKSTCGQIISSYHPVPIVSSEPTSSLSNDLPPRRRLVKSALDLFYNAYWAYTTPLDDGGFEAEGYESKDRAQESRIRKTMRSLAFRALETDDPIAISLLAVAMYSSDLHLPTFAIKGKKKATPIDSVKTSSQKERIRQFREVFGITSDGAWEKVLKRGEEEIEKPGWETVKELRDAKKRGAEEQRDALLESLCPTDPEMPEELRDVNKFFLETLFGFSCDRSIADVMRSGSSEDEDEKDKEKKQAGGSQQGGK